jgi:hypothetical protein
MPLLELARSGASLGLEPGLVFDFIVGRDLFTRASRADRVLLARFLLSLLAADGALSVAQVVPGRGQRLSSLIDAGDPALVEKLRAAEERAYTDPANDLVSWREEDLAAALREAGAREVRVETERSQDERRVTGRELEAWCSPGSSYGRALAGGLEPVEIARVRELFTAQLLGREVPWATTAAFLIAWK